MPDTQPVYYRIDQPGGGSVFVETTSGSALPAGGTPLSADDYHAQLAAAQTAGRYRRLVAAGIPAAEATEITGYQPPT